MIRTHESRWKKIARAGLSALLSLGVAAAGPTEAFAQRRRAEPEANPQFQQQAPAGGAPLGESEPSAPSGGGSEAPSPREVQGVQIGATAPSRGGAAATVLPLDMRVTVRVKGAPLATFLDTISAQ